MRYTIERTPRRDFLKTDIGPNESHIPVLFALFCRIIITGKWFCVIVRWVAALVWDIFSPSIITGVANRVRNLSFITGKGTEDAIGSAGVKAFSGKYFAAAGARCVSVCRQNALYHSVCAFMEEIYGRCLNGVLTRSHAEKINQTP